VASRCCPPVPPLFLAAAPLHGTPRTLEQDKYLAVLHELVMSALQQLKGVLDARSQGETGMSVSHVKKKITSAVIFRVTCLVS